MKQYRVMVAAACLLASLVVMGATTTREVAVDGTAIVAVPNGYRFVGVSEGASAGSATIMNGVTLVPISGTGDVTVTFEDDATPYTGIPSKVMRARIRAIVANPEDVPLTRYVPQGAKTSLALPTATVDFLVISPPAHVAKWQAYCALRKTHHPELNFAVANTADIYAQYPVGSAGVRNPAESIHKYLRTEARNLGVSYVLLGGSYLNTQELNDQGQWVQNGAVLSQQMPDGSNEIMSLSNCVPGVIVHPRADMGSDMFYACLDIKEGQTYPWSYYNAETGEQETTYLLVENGDRTRCPYYDVGVDVIVSRFAFKTFQVNGTWFGPDEIFAGFTNKLVRAESDAFKGTGFIGINYDTLNFKTFPSDGKLPYDYEFFDDVDNLFADYRPNKYYYDTEPLQRTGVRDHIAKYRPVRGADMMNAKAWTQGYATINEAVAAFYRNDHDYTCGTAHGWRGGTYGYHSNDYYLPSTGLTLLNDCSIPCDTGEYWGRDMCMGEAAVEAPFGGALASINNSREGWSGGETSLSSLLWHNTTRAFLHFNYDAGNTWLDAHLRYVGLTETNGYHAVTSGLDGTGFWCLVEHTLFGDPLVRAAVPEHRGTREAPLSDFPQFGSNIVFRAGEVSVSGTNACLTAETVGNTTFTGEGRFKIMKTLLSSGTSLTFKDGIEGGVGGATGFTGEAGTIAVETTKRLYLGGFTNVAEIVVTGKNAILDCDTLDAALTNITFVMTSSATNIIRGIKAGMLAGVTITAKGGTIKFESSDILGGTTVQLEGTRVLLGPDPMLGSLVASGEPLDALFSGSGIIEYPYGTRLLRQYRIADGSSIQEQGVGSLKEGLSYSGTVGSTPTGWITAFKGETFASTSAVLGPNGLVSVVEKGHHPYVTLAPKRGFTLALYADLSRCAATGEKVMLSYGASTAGSGNQILLTCGENKKIDLVVTSTAGGSRINTALESFAYPGDGFHLYIIELQNGELSLSIDGGEKHSDTTAFNLSNGFQIGNQYGGTRVGRQQALGMAFGGLVGYDAILTAAETAALAARYPAAAYPLAMDTNVDYSTSGGQATLADAQFATGNYLAVTKGTIVVPEGTTVATPAIRMLNSSDSANVAAIDVYGTLKVTGKSEDTNVYNLHYSAINYKQPAKMVGVMMGHWAGASTINVYGLMEVPDCYFLVDHSAKGEQRVNIDGGTLKLKGFVTDNTYGRVDVLNGGTLSVATWPSATTAEKLPITFESATLSASADWSCARTLAFSNATIDCAGHNLVFTSPLTIEGSLTLKDSVGGGSIIFLGDVADVSKLVFDASLANFGCGSGDESKYTTFNGTKPQNLIVRLTAAQIAAGSYTTSLTPATGGTIEFQDPNGVAYQRDTTSTFTNNFTDTDIVRDGITYETVFKPTADHNWATLANWKQAKINGSITNYVQKYLDGLSPALTNSNRWEPLLIAGDMEVAVNQLEGWNPRVGVYDGAKVTVGKMVKFQGGDKWLRVGEDSRVTIESIGTGNNEGTMDFYIDAPTGLVMRVSMGSSGNGCTYNYHLGAAGSVVFEKGLTAGTHVIKSVPLTLSPAQAGKKMVRRQLIDLSGVGSAQTFSIETPTIVAADGAAVEATLKDSEYEAYVAGVGSYYVLQNDEGVWLSYVDYAATEEKSVIVRDQSFTGSVGGQTLSSFDSSWTFIFMDSKGYFEMEATIAAKVVLADTPHGLPSFVYNNGSSSKTMTFNNLCGTGTMQSSTTVTQTVRVKGGDFCGNLDLEGGQTRVLFDASGSASLSKQIEVADGTAPFLMDGGKWTVKANYVNRGIVGWEKLEVSDGYAKHLVPDSNGYVALYSLPIESRPAAQYTAAVIKDDHAFVHYTSLSNALAAVGRGEEAEAIRLQADASIDMSVSDTLKIAKNGYTLTIVKDDHFRLNESSDNETGITTYTGTQLVKREEAVALVDEFYYKTFEEAIEASLASGYSVQIIDETAPLPAGYLAIEGRLVKAQAAIGETLYASFAAATNAAYAVEGTVQTVKLLADVSAIVELAPNQILNINANGFALTVTTVAGCDLVMSPGVGVTTYRATPKIYDIRFEKNGGTYTDSCTTQYTILYGEIVLPVNVTKAGCTFDGWFATDDFSDERIYTLPAGSYGNRVFYAKWYDPSAVSEDGCENRVTSVSVTTEDNSAFTVYYTIVGSPIASGTRVRVLASVNGLIQDITEAVNGTLSAQSGTSHFSWTLPAGTVLTEPLVITIQLMEKALSFTLSDVWATDSSMAYEGAASYRSAAVSHNQSTAMTANLNGAGTFEFAWKASSEEADTLSCTVDGKKQASISGNLATAAWTIMSVTLKQEGEHTIVWTYAKDDRATKYKDCGWVYILTESAAENVYMEMSGTSTLHVHTPVEMAVAVAATCTTAGLTHEVVCSDCGTILEAAVVVPAKGHVVGNIRANQYLPWSADVKVAYDQLREGNVTYTVEKNGDATQARVVFTCDDCTDVATEWFAYQNVQDGATVKVEEGVAMDIPVSISLFTDRGEEPETGIAHRWNFNNGSLDDQVGSADALLQGPNASKATSDAETLTLAAGNLNYNTQSRINLGDNLFGSNSEVSFELWFNCKSTPTWSKVFEIANLAKGSGDLDVKDAYNECASNLGLYRSGQLIFNKNSTYQPVKELGALSANVNYYLGLSLKDGQIGIVLKDLDAGTVKCSETVNVSGFSVSAIGQSYFLLGCGVTCYTYDLGDIAFDECRIWHKALDLAAMAGHAANGADAELKVTKQAKLYVDDELVTTSTADTVYTLVPSEPSYAIRLEYYEGGAFKSSISRTLGTTSGGEPLQRKVYWAQSNSGDWYGTSSQSPTFHYYNAKGTEVAYRADDCLVVTNGLTFYAKTAAYGADYQIGDADHKVTVYFMRSGSEAGNYIFSNSTVTVSAGSTLIFRRKSGGWDSYNQYRGTEVIDTVFKGEGSVIIEDVSGYSITFKRFVTADDGKAYDISSYFKAGVNGALPTELDEDQVQPTISAVEMIAEASNIGITIQNPKPGLKYTLLAAETINKLVNGTPDEMTSSRATATDPLTLTTPTTSAPSQFYRLRVDL